MVLGGLVGWGRWMREMGYLSPLEVVERQPIKFVFYFLIEDSGCFNSMKLINEVGFF